MFIKKKLGLRESEVFIIYTQRKVNKKKLFFRCERVFCVGRCRYL
jgi:hypothetical protein